MIRYKNINILKTLYLLKSFGYSFGDNISMNQVLPKQNLPDDINSLKSTVEHCSLCDLCKSKKNTLFLNGLGYSKVMLVTFAPTDFEDMEGRYYAGKAGEIIQNIVTKVFNKNTDEMYITSLLKCGPVKKSTPDISNNVDKCKMYFLQQLKILQPKLIVLFGEDTYRHFVCKDDFEQIKGQIFDFGNHKILATYDHIYMLKNPTVKKEVMASMLKVKNFME